MGRVAHCDQQEPCQPSLVSRRQNEGRRNITERILLTTLGDNCSLYDVSVRSCLLRETCCAHFREGQSEAERSNNDGLEGTKAKPTTVL